MRTRDHALIHVRPPSSDLSICRQPRAGQHFQHIAALQQGGRHLVLAKHPALQEGR